MPETTLEIGQSLTSAPSNTQGKSCSVGKFITESEGWKVVEEAATWEGTPYVAVGANSVKGVRGDCSGTTYKIFTAAGFPYPYKQTGNFENYARTSNRFREIDPQKVPMQAGDVLLWLKHMAIYAPFNKDHPKYNTGVILHGKSQPNNFYTAFNANSVRPYGPFNIGTFRADSYKVFRYLILPEPADCAK
jgi:hypothetical protein